MGNKVCPICTRKNNGVPPVFYPLSEEQCEFDNTFLEIYIPTGVKSNPKPQVKTAAATGPSVITPKPAAKPVKAVAATNSQTANNTAGTNSAVSIKPKTAAVKSMVSPKKNSAVSATPKAATPVTNAVNAVKPMPAKPAQDNRPIVDQVFAGQDIIGLNGVKVSLGNYVSIWNTEQFMSAIDRKVTEDRTISNMNFIIVGPELSGKTKVAHLLTKVLCKTGVRSNEEPDKVTLKEFESALGSDKNMDDLMKDHKGKSVLIDGNLDEAFLDKDGKIAVDANKVVEIFNSLRHLNGDVTLIFELSPELKLAINKVNPRVYDFFYELNIDTYTDEEVFRLAVKRITQDFKYIIDDDAKKMLMNKIKITSFDDISQGRFIVSLFDEAKESISMRLKKNTPKTKEAMFTITAKDIKIRAFNEPEARKILEVINSRIGQASMKKYANEVFNMAVKNRDRLTAGLKPLKPDQPNFLIEGEAGVGKTTSCELLARLLCACGFILNPKPYIVSVGDLQKSAVGGTPEQVREVFKRGKDSLIIIDEAYALAPKEKGVSGNYGQEVVDTVVNELGKPNRGYIVAMLGYPDSLDAVKKMNSGMNRRFSRKILLDNYSLDELTDIFKNYLSSFDYQIENGCEKLAVRLIDLKRKSEDFGNASGVINMADDLMGSAKGDTITKEMLLDSLGDIPGNDITPILDELNALVGIPEVKKFVNDQVRAIKGKNRRRCAGYEVGEPTSYNMVFLGPPGTGKTTVCRLIARLYSALGILQYNDKIKAIAGRQLIAGYVGQTEEKVAKVFEEARGGILYIDEIYQINNGTEFGQSATDALCDLLEARGNSLVTIISGYTDKTNELLDNNPGLRSRFPIVIEFKAYGEEELLEIFRKFIKEQGGVYRDEAVEQKVREWIRARIGEPDFGNARAMRNLAERCVFNHDARISDDVDAPDDELNIIEAIDVPGVA